MTRTLAFIALGTAIGAAYGQLNEGLNVTYTTKGSFVDQGVRADGNCLVTPALMRRFGWQVDIDNGVATILAEGRTFHLEPNVHDGRRLYCLDEAVRYLGGVLDWDDAQRSATVLGLVRIIEKTATGLRVDSTLAAKTRVFRLAGPDRLVVDVNGVRLDPKATEGLPSGWRASQYSPDTVRLVIENPTVSGALPVVAESRAIEVPFVSATAAPVEPVQAIATVMPPRVGSATPQSATVFVPVVGTLAKRPSALFLDPQVVQVTFPGTSAQTAGDLAGLQSPLLEAVSTEDDVQGTTRIVIRSRTPLAFELNNEANGVAVTLTKPRVNAAAGTGLMGRVIVVDAGHGGKDSGATHSGVMEKSQALAIAKVVAAALRQAGASVIMTRSDDTFIPLPERPGVANRSTADLFLSCHFNSNSVDGSRSGIIIFHHKGDSMDMLLAECIRKEIAKEKLLPDMGVWSDGRIYQSGFAVLRGATMPAVLMELGFINHPTDRSRIQSQEFREAVGRAVVRAVKVFFGQGGQD